MRSPHSKGRKSGERRFPPGASPADPPRGEGTDDPGKESPCRVDLHVHSKYSDRPSEWFLRRIGAPESYAEPRTLYRICRERGMRFVTITDHNRIDGALEIADLPGTFLSSEVTTYFPEDGCKIHCLVIGIDEATFRDIQHLRRNVYELSGYLRARGILHSVAHPLYQVDDRLTPEHIEKMILLFDRFEVINGMRSARGALLTRVILENLDAESIRRMADRHGIDPGPAESFRKGMTGGSDDHSSLYAACAYTGTPPADDVDGFLEHLRAGRHEAGGRSGTSIQLAQGIYHIAYRYYRRRFLRDSDSDGTVLGDILGKLAGIQTSKMGGALRFAVVRRLWWASKKYRLSRTERYLIREFSAVAGMRESGNASAEEQFRVACTFAHELTYRFLQESVERFRRGELLQGVQSLSAIGPVLLATAPYVTAFAAHHKNEDLWRRLPERFPSLKPYRERTGRRVWVTDTVDDVNGVAHTIGVLASLAERLDRKITVVASVKAPPQVSFRLVNFEPVGSFSLPEYESQNVVFPPFLEMLAWFEREEFDEMIISTPGPMGVAALGIAALLGIPTKGIYHTDIPQYVEYLTDDDSMGDLAWRYMQWFYGRMDVIFVQSRHSLNQLVEHGFDAGRMRVMGKGVDLELFHPRRREDRFWNRFGLDGAFVFLYVGRVSKEKNLEPMLEAYVRFARDRSDVALAVVGDGPILKELRRRYARRDIVFTGYLRGEALAAAYAGADVFVFPSRTDTFGNVVLEAHACGLPAIVADEGGPAEIVSGRDSGIIVDARHPEAILEAMERIHSDPALRERLGANALERAAENRWETVLDLLCRPVRELLSSTEEDR